ncbi:hypothetical protein KM176_03900 [Pseudooceanicola sp. CBS1P-1]|uniref:Uncharacterized protein n=1 Tax=Pseudooceanicola albus TaxID=2692189 RepID=A0A6L7G4Y2_9RHOB|nr:MULTISPECIES: hypothetical protein [Pseudooceanicola]MBT9382997.1 hypothetical protein [Pseudooceanicola endophyticus]MXN19185.1 hypothetical protein [Pseudooceanicola albus]
MEVARSDDAADWDEDREEAALSAMQHVIDGGYLGQTSRLRAILEYLVHEELAGRGARIKAYAIGTEVLGRGADFNPSSDSIVRVEMARLRRALELHDAGEGRNCPLRIHFSRGSYRPQFLPNPAYVSCEPPPSGRRRALLRQVMLVGLLPAMLVILLMVTPGIGRLSDLLSPPPGTVKIHLRGVGEPLRTGPLVMEVGKVLSGFEMLDLVMPGGLGRPLPDSGPQDYVLEVVHSGEMGMLILRHGSDRHILATKVATLETGGVTPVSPWSQGEGLSPLERLAASLVQGQGPLWRDVLQEGESGRVMGCAADLYMALSTGGAPETPGCATPGLLREAPVFLRALAMLTGDSPPSAEAARPEVSGGVSPLMQYALFRARLARGELPGAIAAGRMAVRLNPHDATVLAGVGGPLARLGPAEEALSYLTRAQLLQPAPDPARAFDLFLAGFRRGDDTVMQAAAGALSGSARADHLAARVIALRQPVDRETLRDLLRREGAPALFRPEDGFGPSLREALLGALEGGQSF